MRDRRPEVEVIQVLTPDDPSWSYERAVAPAVTSPGGGSGPRRRWIILGSFAAVVAIATAVVTFGGTDEPNAALPSTTVAPAGTASLLSPEPTPSRVAAFVLDDPTIRPYSADTLTAPDADADYQLWSGSDPAGPWVTVQIDATPRGGFAFPHAVRRLVNDQEIVDHDGASTVIVATGEDRSTTISAHGLSDTELLSLSLGFTTDGGHDVAGLLAELQLRQVADVDSPEQLVYGFAATETSYLDGTGDLLSLRGAADTMTDRMQTLPYIADGLQTIDERVVGTLRANGDTIVVWQFGDFVLSLTGRLDPATMVALSTKARTPTDDEWTSLRYGLHPDYRIGPFARVATGAASLAPPWGAGVQTATRGGVAKYLWWWTLPDHPNMASSIEAGVDPVSEVVTESVVVQGATYVFVSAPSAVTERHVAVTDGNGTITAVTLEPAFDNVDAVFGVVRVDTPGAVTVQFSA